MKILFFSFCVVMSFGVFEQVPKWSFDLVLAIANQEQCIRVLDQIWLTSVMVVTCQTIRHGGGDVTEIR